MNDSVKPEQNKRPQKRLYILLALGVTAIAVCAFGLFMEFSTRQQARSLYDDMAAAQRDWRDGPAREHDLAEAWAPDFDALRETCPDIVAWIKSEGTVINYPVVRGSNNDYYLYHLPDGERNKLGSIFMDYRNQPDFSDKNTLIYGHSLPSEDMFTSLKQYQRQDYYDAHPDLLLFTPEQDYIIHAFAGYVIDASEEVPPMSFRDDAAFESYIAASLKRSTFSSNIEVTAEDRLVTLCTCATANSVYRYILIGKLEEVGSPAEEENVASGT